MGGGGFTPPEQGARGRSQNAAPGGNLRSPRWLAQAGGIEAFGRIARLRVDERSLVAPPSNAQRLPNHHDECDRTLSEQELTIEMRHAEKQGAGSAFPSASRLKPLAWSASNR
jgi:hypothetical protein